MIGTNDDNRRGHLDVSLGHGLDVDLRATHRAMRTTTRVLATTESDAFPTDTVTRSITPTPPRKKRMFRKMTIF